VLTRKTDLLLSSQLKQKILNDVEEKNNKVIVIHDFATGEKEVNCM
jgi:hypothetical protein